MPFLRIAEALSVGLSSYIDDSPFLLSPNILDCVILLTESFFWLKAVFLRLEIVHEKKH